MNFFHRRAMIGATAVSIFAGMLPARAAGRPRAMALIGDRHHNPDYIRVWRPKRLWLG